MLEPAVKIYDCAALPQIFIEMLPAFID